MKSLLLCCVASLVINCSTASAALVAGDIAIIGFNADGLDEFGWVALTDITANTTINFTDSSWNSGFLSSEHLNSSGPLTWVHSSNITAGTVIRYAKATTTSTTKTWSTGTVGGSSPVFAQQGDQLFAFTGTTSAPTFLYGQDFANNGWTTSGSINDRTSYIPNQLTSGSTAVYLGTYDNGYYSGSSTAASKAEWLARLATTSNWTGRNNPSYSISLWMSSASVTTTPEPQAMLLAGLAMLGLVVTVHRRQMA